MGRKPLQVAHVFSQLKVKNYSDVSNLTQGKGKVLLEQAMNA